MAMIRAYKVQLTPAKIDDRGMVTFLLYDPGTKTYNITAANLADMQAQARALVQHEFKQDASCYVSLPHRSDRKPPGFDAATRQIRTIRYVPVINPGAGDG